MLSHVLGSRCPSASAQSPPRLVPFAPAPQHMPRLVPFAQMLGVIFHYTALCGMGGLGGIIHWRTDPRAAFALHAGHGRPMTPSPCTYDPITACRPWAAAPWRGSGTTTPRSWQHHHPATRPAARPAARARLWPDLRRRYCCPRKSHGARWCSSAFVAQTSETAPF